ncbi:MAG: hypothetical protein N2643_01065 [Endomicrobia bacterium]|nr:hypothetical protein [Endomicrobiia bacterium]
MKIQHKIINFLLILLVLLFCCGKKQTSQVTPVQQKKKTESVEVSQISGLVNQPESFPKYNYDGLVYRDPFVPISPEKIAKASLASSEEARVPSLGILYLKGFIVDKTDKVALFNSPYGSYILYNGKLYDNYNRLVKGFSGKIIFDKDTKQPKSVVLVDADNEYKEYTLSK